MLLVTTAMKPLSDLTTPRRLICPISRHFFPVEQPDPDACCTTGLKKGSRFPVMDHFLDSALGLLASSPFASTSLAWPCATAFFPSVAVFAPNGSPDFAGAGSL